MTDLLPSRLRLCLATVLLAVPLLALALEDEGQDVPAAEPPPAELEVVATAQGKASFYASRFKGRRTASGERYDPNDLTAAHRSLPFGTWVRVLSLASGQEVKVRINDRGPFVRGRVIDLSRAAAEALDMVGSGLHPVKIQVLGTP